MSKQDDLYQAMNDLRPDDNSWKDEAPAIKSLRINRMQILAQSFAYSKHKPPDTMNKFVEYLLEFDALAAKQMDILQQAFEDHLNVCNRPIIITRQDFSNANAK